ncbi:TIR domain-containing protein [Sphingomonas sp. RS6]
MGDAIKDFEASISQDKIVKLTEVCAAIQDAWSGSNLGYHANVYYRELNPPPAGAKFSPEWGLERHFGPSSHPGFEEFQPLEVKNEINRRAGVSPNDFDRPCRNLLKQFGALRRDIISILTIVTEVNSDDFINESLSEIKGLQPLSADSARTMLHPSGRKISRDTLAISQGTRLAPHQEVWADALSISSLVDHAERLMELSRQCAAHLARRESFKSPVHTPGSGQTIFIGHGRSPVWRELKDFIKDTLRLDVEEFGRVSTAGISTTARLSEMLSNASFAFLIMTAEDETGDGKRVARQNVIHEVGLFQGKLGNERAIVLLEDGCEEFTNIVGLGQIRFPANRISAVFEDIRAVLRRENLLPS